MWLVTIKQKCTDRFSKDDIVKICQKWCKPINVFYGVITQRRNYKWCVYWYLLVWTVRWTCLLTAVIYWWPLCVFRADQCISLWFSSHSDLHKQINIQCPLHCALYQMWHLKFKKTSSIPKLSVSPVYTEKYERRLKTQKLKVCRTFFPHLDENF